MKKYLLLYKQWVGGYILCTYPSRSVPREFVLAYQRFETLEEVKEFITPKCECQHSDGTKSLSWIKGSEIEPVALFEVNKEMRIKKKSKTVERVEKKSEERFLGYDIEWDA